jgi:hypothetical protein
MAIDEVDEQTRLLREIAKWTRESALPTVRDRVLRLLDSEPKKLVYDAIATGTLSYRSIEANTGVRRALVSQWVAEWEEQRIVELDTPQPHALFTLRELSIPAPAAKDPKPSRKMAAK